MTPTKRQVEQARAVLRWYLTQYYRTKEEPGVPAMFCDSERVGAFAISWDALRSGDDGALFRLLIATAMFQRLQDRIVLGILRGVPAEAVEELTSAQRLLALADASPCPHTKSTEALRRSCDLSKDSVTGEGVCSASPAVLCHLKRHTVLLKRYGHFGKMPTSVALSLREAGVRSLSSLYSEVRQRHSDPLERSRALEAELSRAWRVSQKIASMFLSAVANPDLSPAGSAPWQEGIDWSYFVVVDSNVDLFLTTIGYRGGKDYDARRSFVQELARRIDLRELHPSLRAYNPRIVQQAMYLFMSAANRRGLGQDCMRRGAAACQQCPRTLSPLCPVRT